MNDIENTIERLKWIELYYENANIMKQPLQMIIQALEKQLNDGWMPVSERLPENNTKVQVTGVSYSGYTKTNRYVCFNARYVGKNTVKVDDMWAYCECDDLQVYNEEEDTFYVEEGWYESIENWDDYTDIYVSEYEIIAWQPLPEPYKEVEQ